MHVLARGRHVTYSVRDGSQSDNDRDVGQSRDHTRVREFAAQKADGFSQVQRCPMSVLLWSNVVEIRLRKIDGGMKITKIPAGLFEEGILGVQIGAASDIGHTIFHGSEDYGISFGETGIA